MRNNLYWRLLAALAAPVLLAGCSAKHHREAVDQTAYQTIQQTQQTALQKTEPFTISNPEQELRERLSIEQDLDHSSQAAMGISYLEPVPHWPNDDYIQSPQSATAAVNVDPATALTINLIDALQIAAQNNRSYQSEKEGVFRTALDLDLQREEFRTSFFGVLEGDYQLDRTEADQPGGESFENSAVGAVGSFSRRFLNGVQLSAQLGWDLAMLLSPSQISSRSLFGDASVTIPLLRGAGRHIVGEPLTQAQRNMVYAIYRFERFKRSFAVDIADQYLSVLQRLDEVRNAEENYKGLIASSRRARRLLDAGMLPPIQVDQAIQDELSARNRWVSTQQSYASAKDNFKLQLGLPVDARIELERADFERLAASADTIIAGATAIDREEQVPPADAPVELEQPSDENAGQYEIGYPPALALAYQNRLDLRIAQNQVEDAQRKVVVAADLLRPEVTLFGGASIGESRGLGSAGADDAQGLDLDSGVYSSALNIDLPFERTIEAVNYRQSYIDLERAVRDLQELEDRIKLDIRNQLRTLLEARESLRIQALSVNLAERRVRGANLNLQAGRIEIRDLLEAQEDLLSAQNALTAAMVNYRITELELQRDLGVLEVNHQGIWEEYDPEENNDES